MLNTPEDFPSNFIDQVYFIADRQNIPETLKDYFKIVRKFHPRPIKKLSKKFQQLVNAAKHEWDSTNGALFRYTLREPSVKIDCVTCVDDLLKQFNVRTMLEDEGESLMRFIEEKLGLTVIGFDGTVNGEISCVYHSKDRTYLFVDESMPDVYQNVMVLQLLYVALMSEDVLKDAKDEKIKAIAEAFAGAFVFPHFMGTVCAINLLDDAQIIDLAGELQVPIIFLLRRIYFLVVDIEKDPLALMFETIDSIDDELHDYTDDTSLSILDFSKKSKSDSLEKF